MKVLGIVGSPRRERGRSHELVTQALAGAREAGAETETMYLIDEKPNYCVHCGHGCFADGVCAQDPEATARSERITAADALVLCAPVYVWQPNALTGALFDKVRLSTGAWSRDAEHGRAALGIAVAGGTGSGVFPALQSIYAWLCLWKYRPLEPMPVTRFNYARALAQALDLGRALAEATPAPYRSTGELMATYDRLPYAHYGRLDEFRWLAEQIAAGLATRAGAGSVVDEIVSLLDQGQVHAADGDLTRAAECAIAAYRRGAAAW